LVLSVQPVTIRALVLRLRTVERSVSVENVPAATVFVVTVSPSKTHGATTIHRKARTARNGSASKVANSSHN